MNEQRMVEENKNKNLLSQITILFIIFS
jgi:hypothetical protein